MLNKFNVTFFFFKKKIFFDYGLKFKGSFLFNNLFYKKVVISMSLSDILILNVAKANFFLKKLFLQKFKVNYTFADKRGSVKFFNFKLNLNKNLIGYFLFNFFFYYYPLFCITKVGLNINLNKLINFTLSFSDFLILKKFLNLDLDFFDYFFKILVIFSFFKCRAIFFNLKYFLRSINKWNINKLFSL